MSTCFTLAHGLIPARAWPALRIPSWPWRARVLVAPLRRWQMLSSGRSTSEMQWYAFISKATSAKSRALFYHHIALVDNLCRAKR